jgi:hypothetical protein
MLGEKEPTLQWLEMFLSGTLRGSRHGDARFKDLLRAIGIFPT